jgi:hypothetical protein
VTVTDYKEFITMPSIAEVIDLYDAGLLVEQSEPMEHAVTCPSTHMIDPKLKGQEWSAPEFDQECTCPPETLYIIGSHGERAAGILPYSVTPFFRTIAELEAFCKLNLGEFRRCAETGEEPKCTLT